MLAFDIFFGTSTTTDTSTGKPLFNKDYFKNFNPSSISWYMVYTIENSLCLHSNTACGESQ